MPRMTTAELRATYAYDHRFVPPDYENAEQWFAEVTDPGVIANMTLQLELHAKHCELVHGPECTCIARHITRTDLRTMLVIHQPR